jgi:hypothetical protein
MFHNKINKAMKVLFIIAFTFSSFGLALKQEIKAPTAAAQHTNKVVLAEKVEAPVMTVLLDTVVITAVAPKAIAVNAR